MRRERENTQTRSEALVQKSEAAISQIVEVEGQLNRLREEDRAMTDESRRITRRWKNIKENYQDKLVGSAGRERHVNGGSEDGGVIEGAGEYKDKEVETVNKPPDRLNEVDWEREKAEIWKRRKNVVVKGLTLITREK